MLMNLWLDIKHSNISITGVPEGEEEEQEIENLVEIIMKENFSNIVKELDFEKVKSPKEIGPNEEHTKTYHN